LTHLVTRVASQSSPENLDESNEDWLQNKSALFSFVFSEDYRFQSIVRAPTSHHRFPDINWPTDLGNKPPASLTFISCRNSDVAWHFIPGPANRKTYRTTKCPARSATFCGRRRISRTRSRTSKRRSSAPRDDWTLIRQDKIEGVGIPLPATLACSPPPLLPRTTPTTMQCVGPGPGRTVPRRTETTGSRTHMGTTG
jgi:hypothetical protein